MMKKYQLYTIMLASSFFIGACNSIDDANDAKDVTPLTVSITATSELDVVSSAEGMTVNLDDYSDDYHYTKKLTGNTVDISDVIPGIYNINVSGGVIGTDKNKYYMNGGVVNQPLYPGKEKLSISVDGSIVSPLIFKEIYFCGMKPWYFHDQFYELYNNSDSKLYLDGIYFANLTPNTATKKLPVWPTEDGNKYCYGERVWKFPGNGTDYPLEPGESCIIAQYAVNHKLAIYNPNSPVDLSSAEFEFNMNNPNYPDQPAYDMQHVFYNGKAEKGSIPFYLTSVFGGAYVIFQIPKGVDWDPVNNSSLKTSDLSSSYVQYYAKIPRRYILDGVEAGQNATMISAKRVPQVVDAGMVYVGATYCGLGVARKIATDANGNKLTNANGTYKMQDTNNSTNDFDMGVVPQIRRYNAKMPSWNHTLK
jgi:hypothetical protein